MTASAEAQKNFMCTKLKKRAWLSLLPAGGIALSFGVAQAGALLLGFGVWWLASYGFALGLANTIQPRHPKRMWAGIVRAELLKLAVSALALACLGMLIWQYVAFLLVGYAMGQLTLLEGW